MAISSFIREFVSKPIAPKKRVKLLNLANSLGKTPEYQNAVNNAKIEDKKAALLIGFFLSESVRYPLANRSVIAENIQAESDKRHSLISKYHADSMHCFKGMLYSGKRVNIRLYVTSVDSDTMTIAGSATIFAQNGEELARKAIFLPIALCEKHYEKSYFGNGSAKPLVKPETRVIPAHAHIVESYVPTKKGIRPKSVKRVSYWTWMHEHLIRVSMHEPKLRKPVLVPSINTGEKKLSSPKKFRHIVNRTESSFEIVTIGKKKVDNSQRYCKTHRKCNCEKCDMNTTRSLVSFVSQLLPKAKKLDLQLFQDGIVSYVKVHNTDTQQTLYTGMVGKQQITIRYNPPKQTRQAKLNK